MNKERIQKKLERASERERRRNKKPEFKSKRRRGQRSCSYRFKKEMVSSTGEGEFASVSLTAPSRAFADYAGTLARASSIAHWQLRRGLCRRRGRRVHRRRPRLRRLVRSAPPMLLLTTRSSSSSATAPRSGTRSGTERCVSFDVTLVRSRRPKTRGRTKENETPSPPEKRAFTSPRLSIRKKPHSLGGGENSARKPHTKKTSLVSPPSPRPSPLPRPR